MGKYLYLNFKNAKLFFPIKNQNDENFTHPDIEGKVENDNSVVDMENLIPQHCVSNMLHYLCGLTPVPFKDRIGIMQKNSCIDEAAKTALIRIDSYYNPDDKNGFYHEIKNTNKGHKYNSHLKCKEVFGFETINGANSLNGEYSFERIRINLGNDEYYSKIMSFIKSIINIEGKTHIEVWNELHYVVGSDNYVSKRDAFVNENPTIVDLLDTNFRKLIFNIGSFVQSSTTNYSKRRVLFNQKGVGYVFSLTGDIIIEVNDDIINLIDDGPMSATLLDGGLVTVTGLKNWIDINENDTNWKKIA